MASPIEHETLAKQQAHLQEIVAVLSENQLNDQIVAELENALISIASSSWTNQQLGQLASGLNQIHDKLEAAAPMTPPTAASQEEMAKIESLLAVIRALIVKAQSHNDPEELRNHPAFHPRAATQGIDSILRQFKSRVPIRSNLKQHVIAYALDTFRHWDPIKVKNSVFISYSPSYSDVEDYKLYMLHNQVRGIDARVLIAYKESPDAENNRWFRAFPEEGVVEITPGLGFSTLDALLVSVCGSGYKHVPRLNG